MTLIKSEQIISIRLLLLGLEEEWEDPAVAGNFHEVVLCLSLARIERKVRNILHPQSLQKGLGSQSISNSQSREKGTLDIRDKVTCGMGGCHQSLGMSLALTSVGRDSKSALNGGEV